MGHASIQTTFDSHLLGDGELDRFAAAHGATLESTLEDDAADEEKV